MNNGQNHPIKQINLNQDLPNISHEPKFRSTVITNSQLNKDFIKISLTRPKDFKFIPGQYIWLVIPELSKHHNVIDRKPYSIASSTNDKTLDLIIHLTGSNYLSIVKSLESGDEVEIIGPMGSAFNVPNDGVIMIADDTGMPQFLSSLRSQIAKNITIIICNPNSKLSYIKSEMDDLSNKFGYQVVYRKSKPEIADLTDIIKINDKRPIFISGPQNFVNFITDILSKYGIAKEQMGYQENYPQIEDDIKIMKTVDTFLKDEKIAKDQNTPNKLTELFLQAAKNATSHVILTDRNGHILFANQAATKLTGYSYNEMRGQTPRLWGGLLSDSTYKEFWSQLRQGSVVKSTVINRRRDGLLYTTSVTVIPIVYSGIIIAYLAAEDDITSINEIDKAKSEFVPIISHQLRTLLSVISWYTEMLIDGDAGKLSIKQKKYLKAIYTGNQHMVELLNSLLSISRIELGALTVEPTQINIDELTKSVINEQKLDITEKKINLTYLNDSTIPVIQADPKLLRMILQNLLSNSIKYTPDKGEIKIEVSPYDKRNILIKVSDNGCGIPKAQQPMIFTKLFRADNAKIKDNEGTGLGLYIVKSITEKTNGKVWFKSKENKGSTFYVVIPIKAKPKK